MAAATRTDNGAYSAEYVNRWVEALPGPSGGQAMSQLGRQAPSQQYPCKATWELPFCLRCRIPARSLASVSYV
jgi:hypothetical protein